MECRSKVPEQDDLLHLRQIDLIDCPHKRVKPVG